VQFEPQNAEYGTADFRSEEFDILKSIFDILRFHFGFECGYYNIQADKLRRHYKKLAVVSRHGIKEVMQNLLTLK
jgi:hypothetical protein